MATSEEDFTKHGMIIEGAASVQASRSSTDANRWTITLVPSGYDDMQLVIPAFRDCDESGAICTENGNPLTETIVITVPYSESGTQNNTPHRDVRGRAPAPQRRTVHRQDDSV